jgi:hypothetical protein
VQHSDPGLFELSPEIEKIIRQREAQKARESRMITRLTYGAFGVISALMTAMSWSARIDLATGRASHLLMALAIAFAIATAGCVLAAAGILEPRAPAGDDGYDA